VHPCAQGGKQVPPDGRNLISGNQTGIDVSGGAGSGNVIEGNLIGTNASGTSALGNTGSGIDNTFGPFGLLIGGTTPGAGNVISGNQAYGIVGGGHGGVVVEGNYIGTDVTGTQALGNAAAGILGGNTIGGAVAGAGNVISGNGIGIRAGGNEVIQGNLIGTDYTGTKAIGNSSYGILSQDGGNNIVIGGLDTNTPGQALTGGGNLISGNPTGIHFSGNIGYNNGSSGIVIVGNYIGTDITGMTATGSDGNPLGESVGVELANLVSQSTIGGTTPAARNIISGNTTYGIHIGDLSGGTGVDLPSNNVVEGNYIGTNVLGNKSLGNGLGVFLSSSFQEI
jgi:titin